MIKVVGYARVSSDEQAAKDLSIPAQVKAIRKYVEDNDEMMLVEIFKDEGVSAYASADKRTGFMSMISMAKDSDVSLILVHKLDRFSRNREESIIFKSLLKKHNATVKSITENFDPDTPSGFLFEGIIEVINQFYSMNLAMETRKGMIENVQRGYFNGGVTPYGFKKIEVEGRGDRVHKKLALGDPVEVATVRMIFDLAVNHGLGAKAIANRLKDEGIPYRNGKLWGKQRIGYILNNHIYYGAGVWNRTHTKTRTLKPEEEWIIVEGNHDPIVPKELFMKRKRMAQETIGDRFQSNAHKTQWLLAKMIQCGECGKAYVGVRRKRMGYQGKKKIEYFLKRYVCSGHINQTDGKCESFYIDQDYLEDAVIKLIKQEIARKKRLSEIEEKIKARLADLQNALNEADGESTEKIRELDLGIENFYNAIGTGMDPEVCKVKIDELQAQKGILVKDLKNKEMDIRVAEAFENDMVFIRKLARNFDKEVKDLPFEKRRMLVLHFVERIDIIDHEVARVILRIPKLTPGTKLKPPMARKTRKEIALEDARLVRRSKKTSPDANQVRSEGLPEWGTLDQNNWYCYFTEIPLPKYLGNGMILNPEDTLLTLCKLCASN